MTTKHYTSEQIIHKLREADVELAGGKTVPATEIGRPRLQPICVKLDAQNTGLSQDG